MIQQGNVTLTKSFHSYVMAYWIRHCRQAKKTEEIERLMDEFAGKSKLRRARTFSERGDFTSLENLEDAQDALLRSNDSASKTVRTQSGENMEITAATKLVEIPQNKSAEVFHDFLEEMIISPEAASDFLGQYIARGADLDVQDQCGNTLLHEAVRFRQIDMVEALSSAGAKLDIQNTQGNTPVHLAAMYSSLKILQHLLLAGADKNTRNMRGQTPLHLAVIFSFQDLVEFLLSANADVLAKDHQGNTSLHYAAARNDCYILELLLLMGYNPDGRNVDGESALSLAIKSDGVTTSKQLLDRDAILTEEDKVVAMSSKSHDLIQLICQYDHTRDSVLSQTQGLDNNENVFYRVQVSGKNGYAASCERCNITRWLINLRRTTNFKHYSSVEQLYQSANDGRSLRQNYRVSLLKAHPGMLLLEI